MERGATGQFVTTSTVGRESVRAFIPDPLPPHPPLTVDSQTRNELDSALLALGRLDSVSLLLPDTHLFLYSYIRREAVLSSQIEGTQSSLADLLLYENESAPGAPLDDVIEVSNYVAALQHGLERLAEGFPLSNRLIREIHGILLSGSRGEGKTPGEFRRSQNWIGGTRPGNAVFVPPPPDRVADCMAQLERFIQGDPQSTPALIKAALAHAQFATIHPFLDGNGRVGRLLIPLLLCSEGVLREPLLYLSLYFKQRRSEYYQLLLQIRDKGDWEIWLLFFAQGVKETADAAVSTSRILVEIAREDRSRIQSLGRVAGSALHVHQELQARPIMSIPHLVRATSLTAPTVTHALRALEAAGIVRETSGRRRGRLYAYSRYLDVLNQGTEIR